MTVYVLIIQDRHCDTDAKVFTGPEKAIVEARRIVAKYARHPEDIEEQQIADWIFYCRYSCESDCVYVLEREVDAP